MLAGFRQIVSHGVIRSLTKAAICEEGATRMFEAALACGAGESDLGYFGPWLFQRDALEFVDAELDRIRVSGLDPMATSRTRERSVGGGNGCTDRRRSD